jgi:hypothetical protein
MTRGDPITEKERADRMEESLHRQIAKASYDHAAAAGLSDQERGRLRQLVTDVIHSLHLNALINATRAALPPEVVLTTVLDAIAGWDQEIDQMSGKPDHQQN